MPYDPICVQVGKNIRRLRDLEHVTQAELGEALGVSFQQIQKYEKGANRISVPMLYQVKNVLGCTWADLLAGLDDDAAAAEDPSFARLQGVVYRMSRAVQAIKSPDLQERLIYLAQGLAAGS